MSRLVQTGSTARANTRNKCYRGLSSKQVESSAIRRHVWWILLRLGENYFWGHKAEPMFFLKKGCNSSHPTTTTNETMTSTSDCTFGHHCSCTIIFTPSALVDNESPTPIRLSQLTLLRHLPPHTPLLCLCCQRCRIFSFRGSFLWVRFTNI